MNSQFDSRASDGWPDETSEYGSDPRADASETSGSSPGDPAATAQATDAALADSDENATRDALGTIERELRTAQEETLRAHAELENFRKRVRREMDDERKYASFALMRDLLPVLDNLTRALDAASASSQASSLVEGVRMVASEFDQVLERHNCKRIQAAGQPFDPAVHAAIGQLSSRDQPPGTVVLVAVEGYQLLDRVLRPAQVIVAAPPPTNEPSE